MSHGRGPCASHVQLVIIVVERCAKTDTQAGATALEDDVPDDTYVDEDEDGALDASAAGAQIAAAVEYIIINKTVDPISRKRGSLDTC